MYVPLDPAVAEREAHADRLLRRVAQNTDAPFYTEHSWHDTISRTLRAVWIRICKPEPAC